MKKLRAAEEKQKQKEEEAKLEKRIQEQQERMKKEYDEEVAKKRAKEEAVSMGLRTIINHWKCKSTKCMLLPISLPCFLFTEIKTSRRDESQATGITERDRTKKKRSGGKEISGPKGSSPK